LPSLASAPTFGCVEGTRTNEGLEFLLRPRGAGRYSSVVFLTVWLCGWAVGEAFALWTLVRGAIALMTGAPPGPGRDPLVLGPALAVATFLLVWLFFWTIGGYAAARHLLQLLWSSDRIVAGAATLRVLRQLGPFRSIDEFPRETLRRIYLTDGDHALTAETGKGPVAISSLGTPTERDAVARALRDELRVPEEPEAEGTAPSLPEGWEEIVTPEGERALVKSLATRRRQATVALVVAAAVGSIALILVRQASRDPKVIGLAAMACVAAVGLGWGADRLRRGRVEWRIGTGTLTRRRRYGASVRDRFEGTRLELTRHSDSDSDYWYTLAAVAADAPDDIPSTAWRTGRKNITSVLRDPAIPRRLGLWLADRARLPFADKATKQALAVDTERALAELRESGAIGRRVAGWIERREARHGRKAR